MSNTPPVPNQQRIPSRSPEIIPPEWDLELEDQRPLYPPTANSSATKSVFDDRSLNKEPKAKLENCPILQGRTVLIKPSFTSTVPGAAELPPGPFLLDRPVLPTDSGGLMDSDPSGVSVRPAKFFLSSSAFTQQLRKEEVPNRPSNLPRDDNIQQSNPGAISGSEVDAQSERKVRQSSSTPRGRADAKGLNSG
ncbi:hypothetical protein PTTG_26455 [Puccinia triticina 1-1 BBBD Race 1]|uniref:Uncharacterized protein n=1 Tax=Puccinia triticina (isolate 1-1 / race 1 (BBBD)) TaxID=630390 RepID=A0A180GTI6_PUCT1|nr:hypothetical protein PTTG_26455 [Puccinia triticina 1-1 BBBD Race 1]